MAADRTLRDSLSALMQALGEWLVAEYVGPFVPARDDLLDRFDKRGAELDGRIAKQQRAESPKPRDAPLW